MRMSDMVAQRILELLKEQDGFAEIKRGELAEDLGCVPSQINYVLTSRFTPEHGYTVESRRGGGGSIKIRRVAMSPDNYMMHVINSVGDQISQLSVQIFIKNFYENGRITLREAELLLAALSDQALPLPQPQKDQIRAGVFKKMLTKLS